MNKDELQKTLSEYQEELVSLDKIFASNYRKMETQLNNKKQAKRSFDTVNALFKFLTFTSICTSLTTILDFSVASLALSLILIGMNIPTIIKRNRALKTYKQEQEKYDLLKESYEKSYEHHQQVSKTITELTNKLKTKEKIHHTSTLTHNYDNKIENNVNTNDVL